MDHPGNEKSKPSAENDQTGQKQEGTSSPLEKLSHLSGTIQKAVTEKIGPQQDGTSSRLDQLKQLPGTIQKAVTEKIGPPQEGTTSPLDKLSQLPGSIKRAVNDTLGEGSSGQNRSNEVTDQIRLPDSIKQMVGSNQEEAGQDTQSSISRKRSSPVDMLLNLPESIRKIIAEKQEEAAARGFHPLDLLPDSIKQMISAEGSRIQEPSVSANAQTMSAPDMIKKHVPESIKKMMTGNDGEEGEPSGNQATSMAKPDDS